MKSQLQKGALGQGTGYTHVIVNAKFATWLKIGSPLAPSVDCTVTLDPALGGFTERNPGGGLSWQKQQTPQAPVQRTFLVSALGRVPKWGSAALSTGLLMSEGTDSVLRILATEEGKPSAGNRPSDRETRPEGRRPRHSLGRKDIRQAGASFVHLL